MEKELWMEAVAQHPEAPFFAVVDFKSYFLVSANAATIKRILTIDRELFIKPIELYKVRSVSVYTQFKNLCVHFFPITFRSSKGFGIVEPQCGDNRWTRMETS
jgi:hypothetical protein